jgi:hypothetical protein
MNWKNNSPQIIAGLVVIFIIAFVGTALYLNNINKNPGYNIFSHSKDSPSGVFKCNCKGIIPSIWNKIEFKNGLIKTDLMVYKYEIKDSYILFVGGENGGSSFFKIKDNDTIEGVGILEGCFWVKVLTNSSL